MTRLAEKNRVRTVIMGGSTLIATMVKFDGTLANYIFQDDVTVIGIELWGVAIVNDAHANADLMVHAHAEVSRQGKMGQPGSLINITQHLLWTAAISVGQDPWAIRTIFFPAGYGVEMDEGEGLNINSICEYIGAGGTFTWDTHAVIYYVERA